MALVIEDGSGVAGANSYISVSDAQTYATARGISVVLTEASLIKACDYIEALRAEFQGSKVDKANPLQWPRYGVQLDGFDVDEDEIPDILPQAQAQLACDILGGTDIMPNSDGREVVRERIEGAVDVQYSPGNGPAPQPILTAARALLDPLLVGGGSGVLRTVRI